MADKKIDIFDLDVKEGNRLGRRLASTIGHAVQDVVRGAAPGRRGVIGKITEPFDPNALDGDGDMLVQDGTIWERPVTSPAQIPNPTVLQHVTGDTMGGTRTEARRETRRDERKRGRQAPVRPQPRRQGILTQQTRGARSATKETPDRIEFWRTATIDEMVEAAVPDNGSSRSQAIIQIMVGDRGQYESDQAYNDAIAAARDFHKIVVRIEESSFDTLRVTYDSKYGAGSFDADADNPRQMQERMREQFGSQTAYRAFISSANARYPQLAWLTRVARDPNAPAHLSNYVQNVLNEVDQNPNSPTYGLVEMPEVFGVGVFVNPLEAIIASAVTQARGLSFRQRIADQLSWQDMLFSPGLTLSANVAKNVMSLVYSYFQFVGFMQSQDRQMMAAIDLDKHVPLTYEQLDQRMLYAVSHLDTRAGANGMFLPDKRKQIFVGQGFMNLLGIPSHDPRDVANVRDVLKRTLENNPEFLAAVRVVGLPVISKTHRALDKHVYGGLITERIPDSILDGTATEGERQRWKQILQSRDDGRIRGIRPDGFPPLAWELKQFDAVPEYIGGYTTASGHYTFDAGVLHLEGSSLNLEAARAEPKDNDFAKGQFSFTNLDTVDIASDEGLLIHEFGHYIHNVLVMAINQILEDIEKLIDDPNSDLHKLLFPNATQSQPASRLERETAFNDFVAKMVLAGGGFGGQPPAGADKQIMENGIAQQDNSMMKTAHNYTRKYIMQLFAQQLTQRLPSPNDYPKGRRIFDSSTMSPSEIEARFNELLDILRVITHDTAFMSARQQAAQIRAVDQLAFEQGLFTKREIASRHRARIKEIRDAAQGNPEPYINTEYGNTNTHERFAEIVVAVLAENAQNRPILTNDAAVLLVARILGLDVELDMGAMEMSRTKKDGTTEDATHLVTSTLRAVAPELRRQTHGHRPNLNERGAQSRSEMARFDPDERSRMAQSRSNIGMDTDSRLYAYDEPISVTHRRSGATVFSIGDHHFYINKKGYPSKNQRDIDGFEAALRYVRRSSVHDGDMMRYISSTLFGLFLDDMNVHETTTEWDKETMRGLVAGEIADLSAGQRSVIEQALQGAVAIHNSIQDATPSKKQMFRHLVFDPKFFGDHIHVGEEFPMPISAFTTEHTGDVGGVVLILRPGAKAVEAIANIHLTAGTFKVIAKRMDGSTLFIELEHTETMDLKHQAMRPVDPLLDTAQNMRQLGKYGRRYTAREAQAIEDDRTKRFNKNIQRPKISSQDLMGRGARSSSGENIENVGEYVDGKRITPWTTDADLVDIVSDESRGKAMASRARMRKDYPDWEEAPMLVLDRAVDLALSADLPNDRPVSSETEKIRKNKGKYGLKIFAWVTNSTRTRFTKALAVFRDKYQGAKPWVEDGKALQTLVSISEAHLKDLAASLSQKILFAVTAGRVVRPDGTPGDQSDIAYAQRELIDMDGHLTLSTLPFNSTLLRHFLATGELLLYQSQSSQPDYSRTRRNDQKNRLVIRGIVDPVTQEDKDLREYLQILLSATEAIERAYFLDGSYRNQVNGINKNDRRGIVPFRYSIKNARGEAGEQRTHLLVNNRFSSFGDTEEDGVFVAMRLKGGSYGFATQQIKVGAGFNELIDKGNGVFEQGEEVGSSQRTITINHGTHTIAIKHSNSFFNERFQDNGWGTVWNQHAWQWLKQIPGTTASLGAVDDGPLVWPRMGFLPDNGDVDWEKVTTILKLALLESDETIPIQFKEYVKSTFDGRTRAGLTFDTIDILLFPESEERSRKSTMRERIAAFIKLIELDLLSVKNRTERRVPASRLVMLANLIQSRVMSDSQRDAWRRLMNRINSGGQFKIELTQQSSGDDPDYLPSFVIDEKDLGGSGETISSGDKVAVEAVSTLVRDALNGTRPSEVPRDMFMPHPELIDDDLQVMGGYGPGGRNPRRDDARFATVSQEQASRLNQILGPFGENAVPQSPRAIINSSLPLSAQLMDGTSAFMVDTLETAREIAGFVGAPELMTRRDLMAHQGAEVSYSVIPDRKQNIPIAEFFVREEEDSEWTLRPKPGRDAIGRVLFSDEMRTEDVSRFLTGRPFEDLQLVSTRDPISQIYHLTSSSTQEIPAEPADNPYGVVHIRKSFTRTTSAREILDIAQRLLGGSEVADNIVTRYKKIRNGDSTETIDSLIDGIIARLLGQPDLLGDAPMVESSELSFDDVQGGRIVKSQMTLLRMNTLESILTHLNEQQRNDALGITAPHKNDYTNFPFLVDASRYTTFIQKENEDKLLMDFRGEAQSAPSPEFRTLEGVYRVVYLLAALNNQQENTRAESFATNAQVIVDELRGIQKGLAHLLIRTAARDTLAAQTLAVLLGFDEYKHDGRTFATTRPFNAITHRRSQHAARGDRTLGGTHGTSILNVGSRVFMDEPVSIREAAKIADAVGNPMRSPGIQSSILVRNAMNRPTDWEIRADWFVSNDPQVWRSDISPIEISERQARSASFIRQVRQDWGTDIREEPRGERGARSESSRRRAIQAREDLRYGQVRWTSTDEEFNNLLNDLRSRYAALSEELDRLEDEQTDDDESIVDPYYTDYLDRVEEITRKQQEIEDQIAALVNTSNRAMTTAMEIDASIQAIDDAMQILEAAGIGPLGGVPTGALLPDWAVFNNRIATLRAQFVQRRERYDFEQARRRHKKITDLLEDEFDLNWGVQNPKSVEPVYLEDFDEFDHEWQKETTTKYLVDGFINPDFDSSSGLYTELDSTRDEWKAIFAGMTRKMREAFKENYDKYLDDPGLRDPQYDEDIVSATRPSATTRPNGVPLAVWRKIRAAVARARSTTFEGERDNAYDAASRLLSRHRPDLANDTYVRGLRSSSGTPSGLIRSQGVNRSTPSMRGSAPDAPSRPVAERPLMRLMSKLLAMGVQVEVEDFTRNLTLPRNLSEAQRMERAAVQRVLNENNDMVERAFGAYRDDFPGALAKIEEALAGAISRGNTIEEGEYRLQRVAIKMAMATMELMREDGLQLMSIEGHAPKARKVVGAMDTDIVDVLVDDIDMAMIRTQGAPTLEQIMDIHSYFRAEVLRLHRMFGGDDRRKKQGTTAEEDFAIIRLAENLPPSSDVFDHREDAFRNTLKRRGERAKDDLTKRVYFDDAGNEVARAPDYMGTSDYNRPSQSALSKEALSVIDSMGGGFHTTFEGFLDSLTFDNSVECNDAIYHAMLEEMGIPARDGVPTMGDGGLPREPLARLRAYVEASEWRASQFQFAATPAGEHLKSLVKMRIDRMKMILEMVERMGRRYVHNMREHGLSDEDIILRLKVMSKTHTASKIRYFKGIVPTLGQSSRPFLESAIGFWKGKFQQHLMPAIGTFSVNELLTHETGHLLLGQGFTRHGEFTANLWPYAVHGSAFYPDFVRIQRNQGVFEIVTLHEALGLVLTPEQRQHYKNGMDLGLKKRISRSVNDVGLDKLARPLTNRHLKIVRDGMVERIKALPIPEEDKNILIEQIDQEVKLGRFVIKPELGEGLGATLRNDLFTDAEKEDLVKLGFDPELQEHQYRSSEVTSSLYSAYSPYIAIPPRLFGWQRASADDRGARSSSGPRWRGAAFHKQREEEIIRLVEAGFSNSEIAQKIGIRLDSTGKLVRKLKAEGRLPGIPDVPRHMVRWREREEAIIRLVKAGFSRREIGDELKIPQKSVGRILTKLKAEGRITKVSTTTRDPRSNDEAIIKLVKQGFVINEIASQLGQSRQNVTQKIRRLQKAGMLGDVAKSDRDPYRDYEAIIKLVEQGLSVTEIASQLGQSPKNVGAKIGRLKKAGRVGIVAKKVRVMKDDELTINRRIARKKRLDAYAQYRQNLTNGMSRAEAIDAFNDAMGDEDFRVTSERGTAETRFSRKDELSRLLEVVYAGAAPDKRFRGQQNWLTYDDNDYIAVNEMKLLGFSIHETAEHLGISPSGVNAYRQLNYRILQAERLTDKEFKADIDALARAITGRGARSQSNGGTRTPSQILAEGPKELLYGRDADGVPTVGTAEQNKLRFGDSKRKVERYFFRKYGIRLKVAKSMFDEEKYPEFYAAGYGALQALEELLMNVPGFKKLSKGNNIEFVISDGGVTGRHDLETGKQVLGSFGPVPNLFRSFGFGVGDRTRTQYTINLHQIRRKTESFMAEWFQEGHQQGRLIVNPRIVSDIFALFNLPTVTQDMFLEARSIRDLIRRQFLPEPYDAATSVVASRTAYATAIHEFGHFLDYSLRDPSPVVRMPSKIKMLYDTYISRKYEKLVDEQGNPRKPTAIDIFGEEPQAMYPSYKRRAAQMALTQVTRYGASSPTESLAEAWAAWWLFARAPVIRTHPELTTEVAANLTGDQLRANIFPKPIAETAVPLIRPLIFDLGTNIKSAEVQDDIIDYTVEPLVALFVITPFLNFPKKKIKTKNKR